MTRARAARRTRRPGGLAAAGATGGGARGRAPRPRVVGQDRVAREHAEEGEDAGEARLGAVILERLLAEEGGERVLDPAAEPRRPTDHLLINGWNYKVTFKGK